MDVRNWLFDRITVLRENAGLSARALSIAIDHQEDYLSKVKRGKLSLSVVDLEKIAKICGSSLEELFYEKFERYKIDKEIIRKATAIDPKGSDALVALFTVLYDEQERNKKEVG